MELRTTRRGTPCSPRWSDAWLLSVEQTESELNHRICGAIALDGSPCTLTSTSPTGRCRFHGGAEGIGAPKGNTNALIHGLYSRRLRQCSKSCPMWDVCPFSGDDVENLLPKKRPHCFYERSEYDELLKYYFKAVPTAEPDGDLLNALEFQPFDDTAEPFLLHQIILVQILVSRAAAVLAHASLTEEVTTQSEKYQLNTTKVSSALDAYTRLSREYRSLRSVINTKKLLPPPKTMGLASRLMSLALKTKGAGEEIEAEMKRRGIPLKDDPREKGGWPPDDAST